MNITVGIPTSNNEDTIEETLFSIINQNNQPDRVIIVDNSTDSTIDIVKRISKETQINIDSYEQSQTGKGVGGARQEIYEKFHGDILACIDTDNKVGPNWIKEHVDFHKKNPEFGILSNTAPENPNRQITNPKSSDYFGQSNCSIKSESLKKVEGWDRWFSRGEDWDIRIRLWKSEVKSYAKSEINKKREYLGTEGKGSFIEKTKLWSKKKIKAPSSAMFLKKYGIWYLKFHPKHVIGDLLSIISVLLLVVSSFLLLADYQFASFTLLSIPLFFSFIYAYYKGPKKREGWWFNKSDFVAVPIFYVLSISFISSFINIIHNNYDWNYSGFKT